MKKFYVTLEVDAENMKDAEKQAEGISDAAQVPIKAVYPGFNVEENNFGQHVIYTDYYPALGDE